MAGCATIRLLIERASAANQTGHVKMARWLFVVKACVVFITVYFWCEKAACAKIRQDLGAVQMSVLRLDARTVWFEVIDLYLVI